MPGRVRRVTLSVLVACAAVVLLAYRAFSLPSFESNWNAWATYAPEYCEGQAAFNVDWDPNIGVWAIKFSIRVDGPYATEVGGVHPEACLGGLPQGWYETYQYTYVNGKAVELLVFCRAPFDITTGRYYNLLSPYGHWLVYTDACFDNGGWCIFPGSAPYSTIELGGYDASGQIVISTSTSSPGVVLENACAYAEGCGGLVKVSGDSWGTVKALFR